MSFNDNDEPSINIQCWICPICHDDHTYGADCKLQDLYSIIGDHRREIAAARPRIAVLDSRASQFESTLKETMRVRDAKIAKLREALKKFDSDIALVSQRKIVQDTLAEVAALEGEK